MIMPIDKFPFSQEFQLRTLTLLATDRELLASKGHMLKPDLFENTYHGKVFGFLSAYFKKYKDIPDRDILLELVKQVARNERELKILNQVVEKVYLTKLSHGQRTFVKDQLRGFIRHQAYKIKLTESIEYLKRKKYGAINRAIRQAAEVSVDSENTGMNYFKDVELRLMDMSHESETRIPTMLHKLDIVLRGGLGPGELGIVLGASGIGKSIALTNIEFAAIVSGKTVFDYSFEMSELEKGRRMDSRLTGIPVEEITNDAEALQKKLKYVMKLRGQYFIKQFPTKRATVHDIRAHIDLMEQVHGVRPDMVCVDYGMLVQPSQKFEERRFEIQSVHEELRGLAVELKVPVWSPAQTNKKAVNKAVVRKDDIGECWGIIETADVVIALCQTPDEEKEDKMRIFLAKNRIHRSSSIVPVKMEKDRMLLRDLSNLPKEDDDEDDDEEEEEDED